MNTIKRKANSVEMNNNDHRGAKGGLRRLRRPRLLIPAAALACVAAVPLAAGAAANRPSLAKPNVLENFQLRLHDSRATDSRATAGVGLPPTFSRTPSFAWAPVPRATRYEFELSTSRNFGADSAVIWSSRSLKTPAVAVPISLPWITGDHASLYWRVRAFGADEGRSRSGASRGASTCGGPTSTAKTTQTTTSASRSSSRAAVDPLDASFRARRATTSGSGTSAAWARSSRRSRPSPTQGS